MSLKYSLAYLCEYYNEECMGLKKRIVLSFALFLFVSTGVTEMLGIGKTCVFSSVKMQVIKSGEPVRNAQVIRRWEWNELKEEKTVTDEHGYFSFPAVFESSVSRLLPIELVIAQGIYIIDEGEENRIWSNSKRKPEENAEYGGRSIDLICELKDEKVLIEDYGSLMVTMCQLNKDGEK